MLKSPDGRSSIHHMKTIKLLALLLFTLYSHAFAGTARVELNYAWKAGDLFRFDYTKTIVIDGKDLDGKSEERRTEISGVLILEIKSASPSGISGILRLDSPKITLPPYEAFGSHDDELKLQPDRMKTIAHAMESAIKTARWNVNFNPDGTLQLESRTPASTAEWLKELSNVAGWRKKSYETQIKIIESDLGLKVPLIDREILFCPTAQTNVSASDEFPRPQRVVQSSELRKDDRMVVKFTRELSSSPAQFAVPNLNSPKPVTGTVSDVKTREGVAIFDVKMSMLDSLSESYSGKLKYSWGNTEQLEQEVRVEYRLKRLAPVLRGE